MISWDFVSTIIILNLDDFSKLVIVILENISYNCKYRNKAVVCAVRLPLRLQSRLRLAHLFMNQPQT